MFRRRSRSPTIRVLIETPRQRREREKADAQVRVVQMAVICLVAFAVLAALGVLKP